MGMCYKVHGRKYLESDVMEYLEYAIHEFDNEDYIELYHEIKEYGIHNVNVNDVRNVVFQMYKEGF